jgi:SAM-dependent methyltransferase
MLGGMDAAMPLQRALDLFEPAHRPAEPDVRNGYLDILGEGDPTGPGPGQRLMISHALPLIYERVWRPLGGRLLMGLMGPSMADELRIALDALAIEPGDSVLDVGCGPGNFTRAFARRAGGGLVVGLDASATMLAQAAREAPRSNLAYVRGDAGDLPFRDGTFAAVCCFAALYLIEEPMRALDEIARVTAPGGRVALLASAVRGPLPAGPAGAVVRRATGIRLFGRDELTEALRERGFADVRRRLAGLGQFVAATRPPAS